MVITARGRVHGFEHVVDEFSHLVVDIFDRCRAVVQARVRIVEYL
jgi:hypothetical protein